MTRKSCRLMSRGYRVLTKKIFTVCLRCLPLIFLDYTIECFYLALRKTCAAETYESVINFTVLPVIYQNGVVIFSLCMVAFN